MNGSESPSTEQIIQNRNERAQRVKAIRQEIQVLAATEGVPMFGFFNRLLPVADRNLESVHWDVVPAMLLTKIRTLIALLDEGSDEYSLYTDWLREIQRRMG